MKKQKKSQKLSDAIADQPTPTGEALSLIGGDRSYTLGKAQELKEKLRGQDEMDNAINQPMVDSILPEITGNTPSKGKVNITDVINTCPE